MPSQFRYTGCGGTEREWVIQPAELSRSLSATILISTAGASFSRVSLSMKIDLNDSPAEQVRTGYHAGASGILVRSQLQTLF